jgi:hypothetical protein
MDDTQIKTSIAQSLASIAANATFIVPTATSTVLGKASFSANDFVVTGGAVSLAGIWTTPSFNANNFTGSGSMTWTVTSNEVITFEYAIIGKMMFVNVQIAGSSVGGSLSVLLEILIPAGKVSAKSMYTIYRCIDNGATGVGLINVGAAGTTINFLNAAGNNWSSSANNTSLYGQIFFEIQ